MNATAQLIQGLGGPAQVARRLGFSATGGTQRVCNWITRDRIPLQIRVDHPDLFPMEKALFRPLQAHPPAVSD